MPIYEYNCTKCGTCFEVLVRTKKDVPGKCPKCGTEKPAKQFSSFAVSAAQASNLPVNCEGCGSAGTGCGGGCPMSMNG